MANSPILRPKGLYLNGNELAAPEGSLVIAENAMLSMDDVVECRYGLGISVASGSPFDSFTRYQASLVGHGTDGTIKHSANGTTAWASLASAIVQPGNAETNHPAVRVDFTESARNLYWTSDAGLYRIDGLTGNVFKAGIQKAIDVNGVLNTSTRSGFMPGDSQVAYRIVWGYKDANNNIHLGAPSQRHVVQNPRIKSVAGGVSRSGSTVTVVFNQAHGFLGTQAIKMGPGDANYVATSNSSVIKVVSVTDAAATGNVTFTGAPVDGENLTINGVTFTARTAASTESEFTIGGTVSITATNLAAKVNAHSTVAFVVTASPNLGVVTLTANVVGAGGNSIGLTESMTNTTVSAANLTGGAGPGITYTESGTGTASVVDLYYWPESRNVDLTISIPSEATASWFYRVYRTRCTAGSTAVPGEQIDPGDEHFLIFEDNPSGAEITAKSVSFTDTIFDSLLGEPLYSNPNEEGGLQQNDRPPLAFAIADFGGRLLAGNTIGPQHLVLNLLAVGGSVGIRDGDTLTIAGQTYTADTAEDFANDKFKVFVAQSAAAALTRSGGTTVAVTTADAHGFRVNQQVTLAPGEADFQGGLKTVATVTGTKTFTYAEVGSNVSSAAIQFFYDRSIAQSIEQTAQSLVRCINQNAGNTLIYAYYISGPDDPPGRILLEARALNASAFTAAASARGTAWVPDLTSAVSSAEDRKKNAIRWSKLGLPEAMPALNEILIGTADKEIIRMVPVLTTLYVFKEDGLYRVIAAGDGFQSETIDPSLIILGQGSAQVLQNQVFLLSNQGFVSVSDAGVQIRGRDIEPEIHTVDVIGGMSGLFVWGYGSGSNASATAIESERKYYCSVEVHDDDNVEQPDTIWVLDLVSGGWTQWNVSDFMTDGLYTLGSIGNLLHVCCTEVGETTTRLSEWGYDYERNYYDGSGSKTISSVTNATTYVLSSASGLAVGDYVWQTDPVTGKTATITAINSNTITTSTPMDEGVATSFGAGSLSYYSGVKFNVKWAPFTAGAPGMEKLFRSVTIFSPPCELYNAKVYFSTEMETTEEEVDVSSSYNGGCLRVEVPQQHQRAAKLNVRYWQKAAWRKIPRITGIQYNYEITGEKVGS